MAPKPTTGKTKQYSGVANAVKANAPQEPRIHPQQVVDAFRSFGFQPNENQNNDVAYWSTRPVSEGPKLVEQLHKRRQDINSKTEEEKRTTEHDNKTKQAVGRLSDQEISSLYDEYGLPPADPEWARNYLPNDVNRLRPILETQRKAADDMLKKQTKNMVNSVPEVPKGSVMAPPAQGALMGSPQPMGGRGGPGSPAGQDIPGMAPAGPKTPFFVGDHSIVRITSPNNPNSSTIWLVDTKKKVLRPFMSEKAFENTFEDPEAAKNSVTTISSQELGPEGSLSGFKLLANKHGVQEDGDMPSVISPAQLQKHYGKTADPAAENKALSMLDAIFGKVSGGQAPDSGGQIPDSDEQTPNLSMQS